MLPIKVTDQASSRSTGPRPPFAARYLERKAPLHFPVHAEVPESKRHLELRTALYQLLQHTLPEATAGSDQFVYYDALDPKRCVAPDVYLRLAPEVEMATSWKVWERGAPEIAVEFVSEFDRSERNWLTRFERYGRIGVQELLRFDPDDPIAPLRIWDRVEGQLLEREVDGRLAPSSALHLAGYQLFWAVAPLGKLKMALRIASGPSLEQLVPTSEEARRAEAAAHQAEAEAHRAAQARAEAAEAARLRDAARVAELEAELRRRS